MADDSNGAAPTPPPADETSTPAATVSERMMGLFGLAVALGIALIALDLITGGKLAALVPVRDTGDG